MSDSPFAALDDHLTRADSEAVADWLAAVDDATRPAARRWWRKTGRSRARTLVDTEFGEVRAVRSIQLLLAVSLADSPEEAVTACRWRLTHVTVPAEALPVARALIARGREFAIGFVETSLAVELGRDGDRSRQELVQIASGVVEQFGLPLPDGRSYVDGWATALASAWWRTERPGPPPRLGLLRLVDGELTATAVDADTTLADMFRATPRLPEMLERAAGFPGVFSALTSADKRPGWLLDEAIAEVLNDPGVDRAALVAGTLDAMAEPQNASSFRASIAILTGCGFGAVDAATHEAEIVNLLPTVHGWAVPILVSAMLAAQPGEGTLFDLGSTVLPRTEKAPKKALVEYALARPEHPDAAALLTLALDHVDGPLRARVAATVDDEPADAARTVGWLPDPMLPWSGPLTPVSADPAGVAELWAESTLYDGVVHPACWLDLALRLLAQGRDVADAAFTSIAPVDPYENHSPAFIIDWLRGRGAKDWSWRHPTFQFGCALFSEALDRGDAALLSTPTDIDNTLSGDDLRGRLGTFRPVMCGPLDFVQMLLRLRPGSSVPARRKVRVETPSGPVDGMPLMQRWVDGDGFAGWRRSQRPLPDYLDLPADFPHRPLLTQLSTTTEPVAYYEVASYLSVMPLDADRLAAAFAQPDSAHISRQVPILVNAPGEVGDGVLGLLLSHVDHSRADVRERAVDGLIRLVQFGRTDPNRIRRALVERFDERDLSLSRLAHAIVVAADADALGVLWPAWFDVLDRACAAARKPAGLAAALRVGVDYAACAARWFGDPIPPAARVLATAKGSSAAVVEARALVAAVTSGKV
ncbi:hypothetical protein [Gordonia hydrophobica]|uniref:Uncharacterized protein n=1 Tax=Gordonia hydrophobica TaxID=40516 RepID=A0ABZ2TXW0_9ACTN|nr:hypothetical protein [Gordonia hydrophobica]MBM7366524.1 hypothetical protein [Gordonia hydrophobica]